MNHNSDMIKLVNLMEGKDQKFAGEEVGQKPGDQVRGTDKAVAKGTDHPFKGRLVGEDTTLEDVLSKKYQDFKDVQAKEKEKKKQDVAENLDTEELADEIYNEFETLYPNLAAKADRRTIHAAIIDVLNYGEDRDPGALAQDVARAVRQNMQSVEEGSSKLNKPSAAPADYAIWYYEDRNDIVKTFKNVTLDVVRDYMRDHRLDPVVYRIRKLKPSVAEGQINEVSPHDYDSDWDYYDALRRKPKSRDVDDFEPPDTSEPPEPRRKAAPQPEYSFSDKEDRQAGYNMTVTVKAASTQQAEWAAKSFVDHHWGAKKQVGDIVPVADGVVQVHMLDKHKYGMWTPWKGEPPIGKPLSFGGPNESLDEVSDETLKSYLTKVDTDARKHRADPTKRSAAKRNKSVAGFSRAFNKLDSRKGKSVDEASNPTDKVIMDVPLMIRIFEYAREDAQTDMDLHHVAERLIKLSSEGRVLTMQDYDTIVGAAGEVDEAAPFAVRMGTGLAAGAIAGIGGNILGATFGPLGSAFLGGYSAYKATKMGMAGADLLWDKVASLFGSEEKAKEFGMAHASAAAQGKPAFEFGGKKFKTELRPDQARAAAQELKKVGESRLNELGASGSALGSVAAARSAQAALSTKPSSVNPDGDDEATSTQAGSNLAKPPATTSATAPTTTPKPGQEILTPDEQDALDKIKANAGLKSQYDRLLKQAQGTTGV